ncbi:MAG TPA: BatD family protein, partial [Chitinophagaceae bacterium]|nr:BatD family protein [Chitinophagaceae bacterium]
MKRVMNILLFVACGLLACIPISAQAQSPHLKTRLDSSQVVIGDQVHLSFTLEYNPQLYSVTFPVFPDTFNHVEIVQRSRIDTISGRDFNTFKQELTLTCFDSGQWKIPPFAFSARSLQGDTITDLLSDSFLLKVNTIQVDTAQPFKPIFGIRKAALPLTQILLYALAIVLILGFIGFLLWYYFKRRKKPTGPAAPEKILLPHEKALEL